MTMGERLRELRLEKGYSLNRMAEAIGVTPQGYLKLEDGTGGKTFGKLPVIAQTLGCSIDKLFPEMDGKGGTHMSYEEIRARIVEVLKDHPLGEIETDMLAEYADFSWQSDQQKAVEAYRTVVEWLEFSSRISPREEKDLKNLMLELLEKRPEVEG